MTPATLSMRGSRRWLDATSLTRLPAKRQWRSLPPQPLAQSSSTSSSTNHSSSQQPEQQPATRPLTTQDMPSIVQAVLDAVTSQSTTVPVLGDTHDVPSPVPVPNLLQVGTNEPVQVGTTEVVPTAVPSELSVITY